MKSGPPAAEIGPASFSKSPRTRSCTISRSRNEIADELRALHCSLAIDDFGAGYSSLARLRQLPFSELKIDKSYVTDCHLDRVNAGLCETIVELAKRFDLKTVAEGIETTARKPQAARDRLRHRPGLSFCQTDGEGPVRRLAQPAPGGAAAAREVAPDARNDAARLVRRDVTVSPPPCGEG